MGIIKVCYCNFSCFFRHSSKAGTSSSLIVLQEEEGAILAFVGISLTTFEFLGVP